jgi:hypothetical protein
MAATTGSAHFTNTSRLFLDPFFIIKLKETQVSSSFRFIQANATILKQTPFKSTELIANVYQESATVPSGVPLLAKFKNKTLCVPAKVSKFGH